MNSSIRNFAIIAHVDHGKSTLADRFLELTNTVSKEKMQEQFLDQNPVSRERGITIKLAPVRMIWNHQNENPKSEIRNPKQYQNLNDLNSKQSNLENSSFENYDLFRASNFDIRALDSEYILNLIDTPGHVDFSYEVSRTLACCEGAVLLVDATQGIQAQTVAHLGVARKEKLKIIPVVNKIDLQNAEPEKTAKALINDFGFSEEEIIFISAKTGENVQFLLDEIIRRIPFPRSSVKPYTRGLIFDAVYDEHKGVVAFVRIFDGKIKKGDSVEFFQTKVKSEVLDVGYFLPFLSSSEQLLEGEIGYVITGVKNLKLCNVGDTIIEKLEVRSEKLDIKPLAGYKQPKPMVFFGLYPRSTDQLIVLKEGLEKIALTDSSLTFSQEHSLFLGNGFRVGFLGLLHAEIIKERLKREYGAEPLLTMPQVSYKIENEKILEPYIKLTIYSPAKFTGGLMTVCQKRKGIFLDLVYHDSYAVLEYEVPFTMFIRGMSSELKSVSSGFASIDYDILDYRESNLTNMEIKVNNNTIDVLSEFIYKDDIYLKAKEKTAKLKESLPRQQFRQIVQAFCCGKIIAREEIPPFRKDVLAKMSGGDRTRKDKLLKKQKKGKERLLTTSKIDIPQEALYSFLNTK